MLMDSDYTIVIERDADGFLVASVPAIPGCSTQARTLNDLDSRVREAISVCLEASAHEPH